jgi:hypothetical protein
MMVAPHTLWGRVAPRNRPFVMMALVLISASGLVAGMALRAVTRHGTTPPGSSSVGVTTGTTTTTSAPALTPQRFSAIMCPPAAAPPGGSFAISAYAVIGSPGAHPGCAIPAAAQPASGVTCALSFAAASGIPAPPAQTTGANGTATWTVAIPATTHPGTYTLTLHATWGSFGATWIVTATVAG